MLGLLWTHAWTVKTSNMSSRQLWRRDDSQRDQHVSIPLFPIDVWYYRIVLFSMALRHQHFFWYIFPDIHSLICISWNIYQEFLIYMSLYTFPDLYFLEYCNKDHWPFLLSECIDIISWQMGAKPFPDIYILEYLSWFIIPDIYSLISISWSIATKISDLSCCLSV